MHSNSMRTARLSVHRGGGCLPAIGGCLPLGPGVVFNRLDTPLPFAWWDTHCPPPMDRILETRL